MDSSTITDGQLLAYLEGEAMPQVEEALASSADLQRRLEDLREAHAFLGQAFAPLRRPSPADVVDVVAGQASHARKLRVMAYVRRSPAGRAEYTALQDATAEQRSPRLRLPYLVAARLGLSGVLASEEAMPLAPVSREQAYGVAELAAQVTFRVAPLPDEQWRLEGRVTQAGQPAVAARVRLDQPPGSSRLRVTDPAGFFTFLRLAAGRYRLRVYLPQAVVVVQDITVGYE